MVLHVEDVDFSIPQLSGMPGRDAKNRAIVEKCDGWEICFAGADPKRASALSANR